ncbi:class I SAM-dependent methyltransferase [Thiovibrio sp. JS02]
MREAEPFWRKAAQVFHEQAGEYDGWFEESLLFGIELAALKEVVTPLRGPKLEIGVGPGRFAAALGADFGLDPAWAPLGLAKKRGVRVCQGLGEALPFGERSLGTLFLLFTLCFLEDPRRVLAECRRVLKPGGHLVVGMIVADSPWGKLLARKKQAGHPFYRHARFHAPQAVEAWLGEFGMVVVERRSSLRQAPEALRILEHSLTDSSGDPGFAVLVAEVAEPVAGRGSPLT